MCPALRIVHIGLIGGILSCAGAAPAQQQRMPERADQPIQQYFSPSIPYTHLGTAYGVMGPAEDRIAWDHGKVCVEVPPGQWAGMWHQLCSTGVQERGSLDLRRCYPTIITDRFQPTCRAAVWRGHGRGRVKLEIQGSNGRPLWSETVVLQDAPDRAHRLELPVEKLTEATMLSWIAEGGSRVCVDSIGLEMEMPRLSPWTYALLVSYAKLARCFSSETHLVKDRAHWRPGQFDSIPATGMFCLATAAVSQAGIVEQTRAKEVLQQVHRKVSAIPRGRGLLPHFVTDESGPCQVAPGTEFSTVDTSIYFHSMLLAAQLLENQAVLAELEQQIRSIEFENLTRPDGYILHGLATDGRTELQPVWSDWGGETALVVLLWAMGDQQVSGYRMQHPGRVHQGTGFIAELQSLFYPQFDRDWPDAISGVNWAKARQELLRRQKAYLPATSAASQAGVYGLSAGEDYHGRGYVANGVERPGIQLIHPHYLIMSATLRTDRQELFGTLQQMAQQGLLPPWGMVENVRADLGEYLPFQGSLNACFECLGSYHLAARASGREDTIYRAAASAAPLRRAIEVFYPSRPRR